MLHVSLVHCNLAIAKPSERIGVLYSYQNVESYSSNDIVGFQQIWKTFLEAFEETYLDYQFLCNFSPETKIDDVGVNVIFFPLAVDISQDEVNFLNEFLHSGGKLIVSAGIGPISSRLKDFLYENGIVVSENKIAKEPLDLSHRKDSVVFDLPSGNFYSLFELRNHNKKIVGRWKQTNQLAIGGNKNIVYIGYSWGQDIDKNKDIKVFLETIDFTWDNISEKLTREVTKDEYAKIMKEVLSLKEEANLVTHIAEQLNLPVPKYLLGKYFDDGLDFLNNFNSSYLFGNDKKARDYANSAKNSFAIVYSLGIPVRKVEIRAVWLDRGTIVSMRNANELTTLIKNLARTGFNLIFFETINAGYSVYPSMLLPQNPLIKNWDPLKVAIEAAHTNGIELHGWVWTFAVGNTRHNLLIEKPVQYPGPVIEAKGRSWALTGENGQLRVEMQPETWLSPANKKAREFLQELFTEIVTNYDVDGLQLDYIRFPFQKKHSQVGFDFVSKNAFHEATGKYPQIDGPVNLTWRNWKALQVSDFVRDTSALLKKVRPNLKLSAAVFAIDRSLRMQLIQQDWETWLVNNWVDVVYPFYYSYSNEEIKTKLERSKQLINDKGIIIPGFNVRVLSTGELAERITQARNAGTLGFAIFAAEHIDSDKKELLKKGPFREPTIFLPYNKPLLAAQQLLDEFNSIIEKFALTKEVSVLSDSQTQKEVYYLTQELKEDFKNFVPQKANDIEKKITSLQLKVKGWLSLEKYLNRDQRVMYITSYLDQIKTLLNYVRE